MPTVTFQKQAFLKAIGRKLRDEELANKMAMLGTDVGQITDTTVSVEVFPNRPDLLSMWGFARALKAFLGNEPGLKKYVVQKGKGVVNINPNLKTVRPYTACGIVRKLRLDEEKLKHIIDVQEKLHTTYGRKRKRIAMGIYPLAQITLPISFEARSPGDIVFTPLEWEKPAPALQILKDHPKGKEYGGLLYGLREFPAFVDASGAIMSLVPVVNSERTGKITTDTREVFIEVSGFDFTVCHKALLIVCAMLAEMGGALESVELRYGTKKIRTPDFAPRKLPLTAAKVNKLLGTALTQKQVSDALKRMGYDAQGINVTVPAYRTDILHEVDLIEDVAIGHGYDNLKPTIPLIATVGAESRQVTIERKLREIMTGLGFIEVKNFTLSTPAIESEKVQQMRRLVEMENPLTADYSVLRSALIPGLLQTLARNRHNDYPQFIFEIGPVWTPEEEPRLAFVICNEKNAGFTEAKEVIEALARLLGRQIPFKPYEEKLFISGRAAVFPGGYFGEIHPQILTNFELPFSVAAGEIRFRELLE